MSFPNMYYSTYSISLKGSTNIPGHSDNIYFSKEEAEKDIEELKKILSPNGEDYEIVKEVHNYKHLFNSLSES